MRAVVVGAGGTGGYFGGLLARAGHDVTFVARGAHLEALRARGLTVESRLAGTFTLPVRATEDPSELGPVDLVLFCVKTYDTDAAAESVRPLIRPETMLLSLQNGIDNEDRIARTTGHLSGLGAAAYVVSAIKSPGVVAQTAGPGKIVIGECSMGTSRGNMAAAKVVDVTTSVRGEGGESIMRGSRLAAALILALLMASLAVGAAWAAPERAQDPTLGATAKLRKAVEPAGILVHERNLARAARLSDPDEDGIGTRASGNEGYDASADYVANKLEAAGYEVTRQEFEFPYFDVLSESFSQTAPQERDFEPYDGFTGDYDVMTYSASGMVEDALVVPTNDVVIPPSPEPSSDSGCEPEDFAPASETEDQVALIQRGGCDFVVKAENAEEAGYDAAIVFNEGQEDVPDDDRVGVVLGTLGEPGVAIPVIGISFELGADFYEDIRNDREVRVSLDIETDNSDPVRETENIIADTPTGRENRTVVVGAHLDSVPEGPGINDNGSGIATILETALQMKKLGIEPHNRVRFAFWGAEEFGLLGSEYYVNDLVENDPEELDNIALNLNFDMLGSPNFVRFVYDGDGSATDDPDDGGPAGSAKIERVFNRYFAAKGLQTEPTAFDGRSDYGPFIAEDIPAGGLFSGAEDIKTAREQRIYGGTAGEPYDPCYHQPCDDMTNLSIKSLNQMSDAVAHATLTYAEDKEIFVGPSAAGARTSDEAYDEYKGPEAVR